MTRLDFQPNAALRIAPLIFVLAFWLDTAWALVGATVFLPLLASFGLAPSAPATSPEGFAAALADAPENSALFLLGLEDLPQWLSRGGQDRHQRVYTILADRLTSQTRTQDQILRRGSQLAVLARGIKDRSPDQLVQIAERLQKAASQPVMIEGSTIYPTCSVGILALPAVGISGHFAAAEAALQDATRAGSGQIRVFDKSVKRRQSASVGLGQEVARALSSGEIRAWFQPQIAADTGQISGFEALARWHHPRLGVLAPGVFLDLIDAEGKSERLAEVILSDALQALVAWGKGGFRVPSVGVNFSTDQLRNPRLAEHLKWEVDRFDLAPDRITVEILETVISDHDSDSVTRNIRALAAHGFPVDLDDFGTGHASIANIRRFQVSRLKIDRSFVSGLGTDPEQQALVRAILQMANGLGLDCVAEGVETISEQHQLAEMGCRFVQGFGIARPMPFAETLPWIKAHQAQLGGWRDSA